MAASMKQHSSGRGDSTSYFCKVDSTAELSPACDLDTQAQLAQEFEIGSLLNERYFLKSVLGSGGMGLVYLGHDQRLDRKVAIKIIPNRSVGAGSHLDKMLEREARLGAGINHPNIATVLDFGIHGSRSYCVFEFVEGETLRAVLVRRGAIPLEEVVQIVNVLARALDFAHAKGIVHRDLKPENVCLTPDGDFKILDLGIAHSIYDRTLPNAYFGTPAYSSPEQSQNEPVDGKSDQYSLALVAFELLTGKKTFEDSSVRRLLQRQRTEEPPRPSELNSQLAATVDQAILKALEKSPANRFASCREFAEALAQHAAKLAEPRHLLPANVQDRLAFFLSHTSEHSLLARELATGLEAAGFRCWLYERDAVPDIPYRRQVRAALARSAVVIALMSKQSLKSHELFMEVEDAYKLGGRIVPLFVDSTADAMQTMSGSWQIFFDSSLRLDCNRTRGLEPAIASLVAAADALGVIATENMQTSPPARPRIQNYVWATDANQLDITDLKHIVFRNELVDDFLQMRNKCFLAATKGLGKTLLLTYKRQLLAEAMQRQTVTLIPEGRPYLDLMDELRQLPKNYESPLGDLTLTKRIWSAALRISAVSHHTALIDAEEDASELHDFTATIRRWLLGNKIEPTVVFRELTSLSLGVLNRLLNDTENFLARKMRSIHSGTYFFVDKVDQAIRGLSPEAWIYVQAGLIEAAWDLMSSNRHLRVFATIRQEAFSNYQSDIKNNLFGATTSLQYSEEELSRMMDQLATCYEGSANFNEFVGFNVIRHPRRPSPEDCFHFVRRHTFGRPRDLVLIASEISARRATLDENRLGDIVHNLSATALINNIFAEVSVLMDCLRDDQQRARFFSLVPRNILRRADALCISEQFNGLEPGSLQQLGENSREIFHPFRDLYLAGLLGVVQRDPESDLSLQRFRQPDDFLSLKTVELPVSEYYLLHPALNRYMTLFRQQNDYLVFQHLTVGQGLPWLPYYALVMEVEKVAYRLTDVRLRELVHRILNHALTILDSGNVRLLRYEIETSTDWRSLTVYEEHESYDDLILSLDELMLVS
jgi:hypothetical protein